MVKDVLNGKSRGQSTALSTDVGNQLEGGDGVAAAVKEVVVEAGDAGPEAKDALPHAMQHALSVGAWSSTYRR
jgi:hypothetical protein